MHVGGGDTSRRHGSACVHQGENIQQLGRVEVKHTATRRADDQVHEARAVNAYATSAPNPRATLTQGLLCTHLDVMLGEIAHQAVQETVHGRLRRAVYRKRHIKTMREIQRQAEDWREKGREREEDRERERDRKANRERNTKFHTFKTSRFTCFNGSIALGVAFVSPSLNLHPSLCGTCGFRTGIAVKKDTAARFRQPRLLRDNSFGGRCTELSGNVVRPWLRSAGYLLITIVSSS